MSEVPGYTAIDTVADDDTIDPAWGNQIKTNQASFNGFLAKDLVLDIDTTPVTVANTTSETEIYTYTLAADTLGASGNIIILELTSYGAMVSGTSTITFYLGADPVICNTGLSPTAGTFGVFSRADYAGRGTTGTQYLIIKSQGNSALGSNSSNAIAEDSTGDLIIKATITYSAASASNTFTRKHAVLRIIQGA